MPLFERPSESLPGLGEAIADIDRHNAANALVGLLFAITGPLIILLAVGTGGGLSREDIGSWIFAAYGIGGIFSIVFSLFYRQPLVILWTIPGAVLIGPALDHLTFNEVIGAYFGSAIVLTVFGLTGTTRRLMALIPMPIVMGMVAGVFLPFGLGIVVAFDESLTTAIAMAVGFIGLSAWPRAARVVPPVLGALVLGTASLLLVGDITLTGFRGEIFAEPILYRPEFSLRAMAELVIPLTVTVIGIQNAQGLIILRGAGYDAPQNALTTACGLASFAFAAFGSVPACLTGPVNAILNSAGARERRYIGGVLLGLLALLFGLFAPVMADFGLALPGAFIGMLGGLALLHVLKSAFATAFGGRFSLGALVTFLVTISDITIFNIGAAFWGLVAGFAVSWLLEREDYRRLAHARQSDVPSSAKEEGSNL